MAKPHVNIIFYPEDSVRRVRTRVCECHATRRTTARDSQLAANPDPPCARPRTQVRCMKVEPGDLSFKNVKGNIRNKLDLRGHENDEWFLVDEATRKPLKEGDVVDSGALLYLVV